MAERDDRDETTWVVYELTSAGERLASDGQLEVYLREALSTPLNHPIFIPYLSYVYGDKTSVFNVMEGYCFVASGLDDRVYSMIVFDSPYLRNVLCTLSKGSPVLKTIQDSKIQELKNRLGQMVAVEIQDGMEVDIIRGHYQGLSGKVVALTDEMAHVLIEQRTLRTIRTIPRFELLPRGDEE